MTLIEKSKYEGVITASKEMVRNLSNDGKETLGCYNILEVITDLHRTLSELLERAEEKERKLNMVLYEIPKTDVAPVVHAAWVEVCDEVHDVLEEREPYLMVRGYRCSRCNRFEKKMEPYCNCGAKMDLEE